MGPGMALDGTSLPRHATATWLDAGRRAAVLDATLALVVSRLVVWAGGLAGIGLFGMSSKADAFDPAGVTQPFGDVGNLLAAPAARWDSVWYLQIAGTGYGTDPARPAFFPL